MNLLPVMRLARRMSEPVSCESRFASGVSQAKLGQRQAVKTTALFLCSEAILSAATLISLDMCVGVLGKRGTHSGNVDRPLPSLAPEAPAEASWENRLT